MAREHFQKELTEGAHYVALSRVVHSRRGRFGQGGVLSTGPGPGSDVGGEASGECPHDVEEPRQAKYKKIMDRKLRQLTKYIACCCDHCREAADLEGQSRQGSGGHTPRSGGAQCLLFRRASTIDVYTERL